MTIVQRIETSCPELAAYKFGSILAVDKGVQNEVRRTPHGWIVEADDGRAILFEDRLQPFYFKAGG